MKKNYKILQGDSAQKLKEIEDNSIDSIVTDPPYGYKFMGKDWDKALPSIDIWKECLRVLKPGGFAFIMSSPRTDVAARLGVMLEDAGFITSFSPIYWTYASGFPKGYNMGQSAEKKLTIGSARRPDRDLGNKDRNRWGGDVDESGVFASTGGQVTLNQPESIKLKNSYGGFQPKPAVELIFVVMKPMNKKTYVEQALHNNKGITRLLDCSIQNDNEEDRIMSNLIMSDNILSEDSKYFQIDTWWNNKMETFNEKIKEQFPWLLVKKPSKKEKEEGITSVEEKNGGSYVGNLDSNNNNALGSNKNRKPRKTKNDHPTVKPIQLMSYLVNLGSSENEVVLDPFMGSGTTGIACVLNGREFIGIDLDERYVSISKDRIEHFSNNLFN
jgi:site-specific DNA-methyltransferase (adenine-specific)